MTGHQRLPIAPITDPPTAFAFILGVLFNQRMRADDAWQAPHELGRRIGGLMPANVLALPVHEFAERFAEPPTIHPFKRTMVVRAYQAAELIQSEYHGDVRKLWAGASAAQFIERLQAFPGIGLHKATVALFVATRELGLSIRADGRRHSIHGCGSLAQRFHPHHEPLLV